MPPQSCQRLVRRGCPRRRVGLGRAAEAESLQRRALALNIEVFGEKHPATLTSLNNLAADLRALGRVAEAEALDRRALALATEVLGEKHPTTLSILTNLAIDLQHLGRAAEAEPLDRHALALRTEILGKKHPDTITSMSNLAVDLSALGRAAEAEPLDRNALAINTEILGERHPHTLTSLGNLATDLLALGRFADAELLHRRGVALSTEILGGSHPDTLSGLNNLAVDLVRLGRANEAEPLFRRAAALRTNVLGVTHAETLASFSNVAFTMLLQPDHASLALEPARRSIDGIRAVRRLVGRGAREEEQLSRDTLAQSGYFGLLADAAWSAAASQPGRLAALKVEVFGSLQDAMAGTASRAVALAAARRAAAGSGAGLETLAVERQSLSDQWLGNERTLTKTLGESGPDAAVKHANLEKLGKAIEARMAEIDVRLAKEAPAYFAMTRPEALTVKQAQGVCSSATRGCWSSFRLSSERISWR